jgi:hypothetical protein
MAATALGLVRSCEATVMGRLVSAVRAAAPDIGRRLARAARRVRSAVLHLGGLGQHHRRGLAGSSPVGVARRRCQPARPRVPERRGDVMAGAGAVAPVLHLEDDGAVVVVACPRCGGRHRHGSADGGHRVSHCLPGRGYDLVGLEAVRRRGPRGAGDRRARRRPAGPAGRHRRAMSSGADRREAPVLGGQQQERMLRLDA